MIKPLDFILSTGYKQDKYRILTDLSTMLQIDTNKLKPFIESKNIAELLDERELEKISGQLCEEIQNDENSRSEWSNQMKQALAIARQDIQGKSYPWHNASNVKIPLILNGCIQFNSRIGPEIIQGNKIVNVSVMRPDPTDEISNIAYKQSRHMSYQLIEIVKNWIPDTDKLLMTLPLLGTVYRKTYFDSIRRKPRVDLCLPDDIVLDQSCSALEYADRITHKLELSTNQIIERMRAGIYKEYQIEDLLQSQLKDMSQKFDEKNIASQQSNTNISKNIPQSCCECHCWLDLDDDDYLEPYIVLFHEASKKVLRIKARYDEKSWIKDSSKIVGIEAKNYFTDYHFMPSPDGAFMGLGFGQFLYPLNEAVNSITNKLIDAGHLANLQCGFISRALKVSKGSESFEPGEWKLVNSSTGQSLSNSIMPLPVKEPSQTLFNLLQFLLQSARELASTSEPMQGQLPPPNTPATTVLAVLQQGQKVYSSVFHRLYQGLKKEYEKLYDLNAQYLPASETYKLAKESGMVERKQYDKKEYGVFPVADPNIASDTERLTKLQALWNIKDDPNINEREVVTRYVELLRIPDPEKVINPPPDPNAPPPPEAQLVMAKANNLNAQSSKIHGEMLIDADYKSHKIDLDYKQLWLDSKKAENDAESKRVNSIVQLTQTESKVNSEEITRAEGIMGLVERQVSLEFAPFQATQQQQQPTQQPSPQMPQQGMPQGAGSEPAVQQPAPSMPSNIMPSEAVPTEGKPTLGELKAEGK